MLTVLESERLTLPAAESLCHAAEHLSLEKQQTRGSEHRRERHAEAVHVVAASHFLAGAAPRS